jgi:hypothetical protein
MLQRPHDRLYGHNKMDFVPYVYELAKVARLPYKDIAAKCNCPIATLRDYPELCAAINEVHADHRIAIEGALFFDALADPLDFEGEDRAAVRAARASALRILKAAIDKRDDFIPPTEHERIKRLTDEELQAELKKHVKP